MVEPLNIIKLLTIPQNASKTKCEMLKCICRVPLRRGMAFSTSTKNPPLLKTRNITSQNSINWHQIPATPTPPSPRTHHNLPSNIGTVVNMQGSMPALMATDSQLVNLGGPPLLQKQISHQTPLQSSQQGLQRHPSNETDV